MEVIFIMSITLSGPFPLCLIGSQLALISYGSWVTLVVLGYGAWFLIWPMALGSRLVVLCIVAFLAHGSCYGWIHFLLTAYGILDFFLNSISFTLVFDSDNGRRAC